MPPMVFSREDQDQMALQEPKFHLYVPRRKSGSCAGNCGYHVVPVQEILMSGRAKYQELLCSALAAQLAAQVPASIAFVLPCLPNNTTPASQIDLNIT